MDESPIPLERRRRLPGRGGVWLDREGPGEQEAGRQEFWNSLESGVEMGRDRGVRGAGQWWSGCTQRLRTAEMSRNHWDRSPQLPRGPLWTQTHRMSWWWGLQKTSDSLVSQIRKLRLRERRGSAQQAGDRGGVTTQVCKGSRRSGL